MTILAGVVPGDRGKAVLHLSAMLARSAGEEILLCSIVPEPWPPSPARVDAEYRAQLESEAEESLAEARARLPGDVSTDTLIHHARSAPAGLLEAAERHDAALVVTGSSPAGGLGRVVLGSVANRLMHGSPVPVAMPPRGYRCKPAARVTRVTAAYGGAKGADDLVVAAAGVAARAGASLRLASFAVRSRPPLTAGVGTGPEKAVVKEWVDQIDAGARSAMRRVEALPTPPRRVETVVGYGESWAEALEDVEWEAGDVLVVGSSRTGPLALVFLGSRSSKIVRSSPVPVVVVPRGAAEELADDALRAEPE